LCYFFSSHQSGNMFLALFQEISRSFPEATIKASNSDFMFIELIVKKWGPDGAHLHLFFPAVKYRPNSVYSFHLFLLVQSCLRTVVYFAFVFLVGGYNVFFFFFSFFLSLFAVVCEHERAGHCPVQKA
jgi:hypothetical protein